MKKVLIVEDNELHRATLIKLLKQIDCTVEIYDTDNVQEAYRIAMEHIINLFLVDIILDVTLPGDVSGIKFAENIRKVSKYLFTPLIFITSLEDPQLYAFREIHCHGYIEKPFDPLEVKRLIKESFNFPELRDNNKNIFFRKEGIVYAVKVKEIIYIENTRRKLVIHSMNETITASYKTCEDILKELDSPDFIQCSRYTIVNRNYIETIDYVNRYIKLKGGRGDLDIGVTMKKRFRDGLGD